MSSFTTGRERGYSRELASVSVCLRLRKVRRGGGRGEGGGGGRGWGTALNTVLYKMAKYLYPFIYFHPSVKSLPFHAAGVFAVNINNPVENLVQNINQ